MLYPIRSMGQSYGKIAFKQSHEENDDKKATPHVEDRVLSYEREKHPILTSAKINAEKLKKAFIDYPIKGFKGSKNADFYEFLAMGTVPYLIGSGMLIAVFNAASKFYNAPSMKSASKRGKQMAVGVVLYAAAKTLSKKLIEYPIKLRYGLDLNLPIRQAINELPENPNDKDLVAFENHKVFESVDFARTDKMYNNPYYGKDMNAYYDMIGKKMGIPKSKDSDQYVKEKIKEISTKAKTFTYTVPYLWAATGVALAAQKPWENLGVKGGLYGKKRITESISDLGKMFKDSAKLLWNGGEQASRKLKIAGRSLILAAAGLTLLGNVVTLVDFKKHKANKMASTPVIDETKGKVIC